jgi:putative IMPACT (imprinted ancient) family translation regulator
VPILKRIEGAGLVGVAVVVSRWFGGTQLGVGGLVRAYGAAAAAALAAARVLEVTPTRAWRVRYPYECERNVQALLAARAWRPVEAAYAEQVTLRFLIPEQDAGRLAADFADATAGRAAAEAE